MSNYKIIYTDEVDGDYVIRPIPDDSVIRFRSKSGSVLDIFEGEDGEIHVTNPYKSFEFIRTGNNGIKVLEDSR